MEYGKQTREDIHRTMELVMGLEAFQLLKPPLIPAGLFLKLAAWKASRMVKEDFFKCYPEVGEIAKEIAEGAEVSLDYLLFLYSFELLLAQVDYYIAGCSAFSAITADKGLVVVKNFDYPPATLRPKGVQTFRWADKCIDDRDTVSWSSRWNERGWACSDVQLRLRTGQAEVHGSSHFAGANRAVQSIHCR